MSTNLYGVMDKMESLRIRGNCIIMANLYRVAMQSMFVELSSYTVKGLSVYIIIKYTSTKNYNNRGEESVRCCTGLLQMIK